MFDCKSEGEISILPTWKYGAITVAINWLPGVVAAIHMISMYRHRFKASKVILAAGRESII